MRGTIFKILKEYKKGYDHYGYHVTSSKNLESILKNGLIPGVPEDYGIHGDIEGVYLFKAYEDMENALYNWLGERIEEIEEETGERYDERCLKVDISGLDGYKNDSVEYEWVITTVIEPSRIVSCIKC